MKFAIQDKLSSADIKLMRQKLKLKQKDLAALLNVSVKTIERWEQSNTEISGPVVTLLKLLNEEPEWVKALEIPEKEFPLRLHICISDVYHRNTLWSIAFRKLNKKRHLHQYFV